MNDVTFKKKKKVRRLDNNEEEKKNAYGEFVFSYFLKHSFPISSHF